MGGQTDGRKNNRTGGKDVDDRTQVQRRVEQVWRDGWSKRRGTGGIIKGQGHATGVTKVG